MNNPAALMPPPDPFGLPAPAWVFIFLLNLTLVLHFLLMGYVFTATLLQIFFAAGAREGSAAEWMLRRTERLLPVMISFTVTLGVAPLLFVQVLYQPVFYSANILIGFQWFGIVAAVMAAFYMVYVLMGGRFMSGRIPRACEVAGRLFIFACFLYVLVTQTTNAMVVLHPERWPAVHAGGGHTFALHLPIFWPRLLHNLLAALTISSVWMLALGLRESKNSSIQEPKNEIADEGGRGLVKLGALVGFLSVSLQMMVGLWLIVVDSGAVGKLLMSLRPATLLWAAALVGTLALWGLLIFMLTLPRQRWILGAVWAMLALVLGGMFAGREALRQITLAPYFSLAQWQVHPQISSLALFLAMFVLALVLLLIMGRWAYQAARPAKPPEPPQNS